MTKHRLLKTFPICPTAGANRYYLTVGPGTPGNDDEFEEFYLVECAGTAHSIYSAPPFYPRYDGVQGLIDR